MGGPKGVAQKILEKIGRIVPMFKRFSSFAASGVRHFGKTAYSPAPICY